MAVRSAQTICTERKIEGVKKEVIMNCKYCGAEVEANSQFCLKCGKPIDEFKRICPKCNIEVDEDSRFCNKCGWDFKQNQEQHRICLKCGAEMESDAKFCLKCGYGTKARRKIPLLAIILTIVILIAAGIGGTVYYLHQKAVREAYEAELEAERRRQSAIHMYQSKAIELFDAINDSKLNFDLMSTMYSTSTETNTGLLGPSYFTAYVQNLCSSEISAEKSRKKEIDNLRLELDKLDCDEPEVENLKKSLDNYYYSYSERYDLLIEGNFSTFTFSYKESTSSSDFNEKFYTAQEEINKIDRDELKNDEADEAEDEKKEIEGGSTI